MLEWAILVVGVLCLVALGFLWFVLAEIHQAEIEAMRIVSSQISGLSDKLTKLQHSLDSLEGHFRPRYRSDDF